VSDFSVGEIEGGAVLVCPACGAPSGGNGWFSGSVGGKTLSELQRLAYGHLVTRHTALPGPGDGAWIEVGGRRVPLAWDADAETAAGSGDG